MASKLTDYPDIKGADVTITVNFEQNAPSYVIPIANEAPAFEQALATTQTLDLGPSTVKQSITLGRLVDPEGDPFKTSVNTVAELPFVKARVTATGEWILDVDYDATKVTGLTNGAHTFEL